MMLFICHLLFVALRVRSPRLYTRLLLPSEIFNVISVAAAMLHSFLEDQRSLRPSDLLVLFFSASTIFSIPRLHSLWLIQAEHGPRITWTIIFIANMIKLLRQYNWTAPFVYHNYPIKRNSMHTKENKY